MADNGRAWMRKAAVTGVTVVLVAGCGTTTGAGHTTQDQALPAPSVLDATQRPITADLRACAGAEAILGHLTSETAQWSPNLNPFDKTISKRLASRARDLAAQAQQAEDPGVRSAVRASAGSFSSVSVAMRSRKRARVDQAIAASRVTYKDLKGVCHLDEK